jgi:hypothetical protein
LLLQILVQLAFVLKVFLIYTGIFFSWAGEIVFGCNTLAQVSANSALTE